MTLCANSMTIYDHYVCVCKFGHKKTTSTFNH